MPRANLKKQRRVSLAYLNSFPRGEKGVTCGPAQRERHISKSKFRRLAMQSPVEALEHLQD